MNERLALLIVDVQTGAFDGIRSPPIDQGELLLKHVSALLRASREAGVPAIFIQDCGRIGGAFEKDTPHWPIHPSIAPQKSESILLKSQSNAFEQTALLTFLQQQFVTAVIICGLQSECCVKDTTLGALEKRFKVFIAADAHSTWPTINETASSIAQQQNAFFKENGATVKTTKELTDHIKGLSIH